MKTKNFVFKALIFFFAVPNRSRNDVSGQVIKKQKSIDPKILEEYCKNFAVGDTSSQEFYSPMHPHEYPADINCFRTITADYGNFVRIDFRDVFVIEPPANSKKCEYDFLEIRDGDQGYSPLIGKYCGDKFPPIITSSGRSLWLRFSSDATIQYTGFKAVYQFIPNPLGPLPDIGKCTFEASGFQDYIGTQNISSERREHSLQYDLPVDCVWVIRAQEESVVYLQFHEYELDQPNDCNLNYIQVFDGKTDEENRKETFCGSVATSVTSVTDVVYVRFYAEESGINSKFSAVFTSMRVLGPQETCDSETEYDCDDATCIHPDLVCNEIRNCKFGWDEESCKKKGGNIKLDFSKPHVIIVFIILILILFGMFFGMVWNLYRKLHETDDESGTSSREKSLSDEDNEESGGILPPHLPPPPPTKNFDSMGPSCYVPDGGFPFNSRF